MFSVWNLFIVSLAFFIKSSYLDKSLFNDDIVVVLFRFLRNLEAFEYVLAIGDILVFGLNIFQFKK